MVTLYRTLTSLIAVVLLSGSVQAEEPTAVVSLDLVEGAKEFPGDKGARTLLARQGFVVLPKMHRQMFSPYIGNPLPNYITTDSAHRTWHVIFEEVLALFERRQAHVWGPRLRELFDALKLEEGMGAVWRDKALPHAQACVAVAARLLGEKVAVPPAVEAAVRAEVALVTQAAGVAASPLRNGPEDYAQYKPRGLYEGDPELEAWFRAAQWLGRLPFRLRNEHETMAACLLTRAVASNRDLANGFGEALETYAWLLGPADDLTLGDYHPHVLGGNLGRDFAKVRASLERLPDPEINDQVLSPEAWQRFRAETKGLRLLPKRRTADAWLAQTLAEAFPNRTAGGGLDMGMALGSGRAKAHLEATGGGGPVAVLIETQQSGFDKRLGRTLYADLLRAQSLLFPDEAPVRGGGAHATEGAKGAVDMRAPCFQQPAWADRLLTTGLAAWASQRHAWALHAKSTVHFMGMTQDPAGAVEPAPAYYAALGTMARSLVSRLSAQGLFRGDPKPIAARLARVLRGFADGGAPSQGDMQWLGAFGEKLSVFLAGDTGWTKATFRRIADRLDAWLAGTGKLSKEEQVVLAGGDGAGLADTLESFAALMDELAATARCQLGGKPLSADQEAMVREYGKRSAALQFFGGNSWLSPSWWMGLTADVSSNPRLGTHRHAAVGAAMELYVVLPLFGGGHRLHRGAVYSYYEYDHPSPMPDSAWRAQVEARTTPPRPPWTRSYIASPDLLEVLAAIAKGEEPEAVAELNDLFVGEALLTRLETAPLGKPDEDRHLAWVANALDRYADGPLHDDILKTLLRRLAEAPSDAAPNDDPDSEEVLGLDQVGVFVQDVASVLGSMLRDEAEDRRVVALLVDPPAGADVHARAHLAAVLLALGQNRRLAAAAQLLTSKRAGTRFHGIDVVALPHRFRGDGLPVPAAALLAAHLARESDGRNRALLLERLVESCKRPEALAAAQVAAGASAALLGSPHRDVRGHAADLLGVLGARMHAAKLLARFRPDGEQDEWVRVRLARGLGGALRGVSDSGPETSSALLAEAYRLLDAGARGSVWRVAVGCLEGFTAWGSPKAVAGLGAIAVDKRLEANLRQVTINQLEGAGSAAQPFLFRLAFDETLTGGSMNEFKLRICDAAMDALYGLTNEEFGWAFQGPLEAAAREAVIKAARAEAKKRGFGP